MAMPIIKACAVCGSKVGELLFHKEQSVAYCQAHKSYQGKLSKAGECPYCHYRFDQNSAPWFFEAGQAERKCFCGARLTDLQVSLGLALSQMSSSLERAKACQRLTGFIDQNNAFQIQTILIKAVDDKVIGRYDAPEKVVQTIAAIGGRNAQDALDRWSRFFSFQPKEIKQAAGKFSSM